LIGFFEVTNIHYSNKIISAFEFAYDAHKGDYRKGTTIPYIVHPMDVASTLMKNHASEYVVIAGLLHDVVEDTKINLSEIEAKFGKEVATLVEGASEPEDLVNVDDKSENWLERKSHTIETIKNANREMKLLSCADKLANIRDIINDERQGESVWSIFNASKECVAWYYKSMVKTFASGDENIIDMQAFNEFKKCVNEIFGDPNVIEECS